MLKRISMVVAAALAYYFYLNWSQMSAAIELCESFPVGTTMGSTADIAREHGLTATGPMQAEGKPGTQKVVFCASASACDTSCTLEFKDGVITASIYLRQ